MERIALSVAEAARALSVSTDSIYRWIAAGELPATRIAGRTLIRTATLEAFVAAHESSGRAA